MEEKSTTSNSERGEPRQKAGAGLSGTLGKGDSKGFQVSREERLIGLTQKDWTSCKAKVKKERKICPRKQRERKRNKRMSSRTLHSS